MDLNAWISSLDAILWGWPLLTLFIGAGLIVTIACSFVQFRYLGSSLRAVLAPSKNETVTGRAELSPFQAFINSLAANTGNGSIAGMATCVFAGGPGAVVWVLVAGILGMALRFAEVYLGTCFIGKKTFHEAKGGPMLYLSLVPGGSVLPYIYAFLMCAYCFVAGNAMQVNNIGIGIGRISSINPVYIALGLTAFMAYAILGGAQRILHISDRLTPFKVMVFFIATLIVLVYYAPILPGAMAFIISEAFSPRAMAAGACAVGIQIAMKNGFIRSMNAHESGIGFAAVLFGSTESRHPVRDAILSMASTFICTFCISFPVALLLIASGVWSSGEQSLAMTISMYSTVFGSYGPWIVTFISASFGLGVIVACAYVGKQCYLFLTRGKFLWFYYLAYVAITFGGTLSRVDLIWNSINVVMAAMLIINVFGILWLLPLIVKDFRAYDGSHK